MTFEEIVSIVIARMIRDGPVKRRMVEVRDRVNARAEGTLVVPLPDVKGSPTLPSLTPALVADAIDATAMRAASVIPSIVCAPLDSGSERSRRRAATRRRALYASWHRSNLPTKLRRAFRHLVGYGTSAMVVVPDDEGRAVIELRDPLTTYAELRTPDDVRWPRNVAFVTGRSAEWLVANFGVEDLVREATRAHPSITQDIWDVMEWWDEEVHVVGILGPRSLTSRQIASYARQLTPFVPNRLGFVPAVVPERVTLDRVAGQVANILGITDHMDRLMALDVVASEKFVFPDMVAVSETGFTPILNETGEWYDGRTGRINVVSGVRDLRILQGAPGPLTTALIDRYERAARLSGGNPGLYTGELTGALRSGQTVNALASQASDPRIAEYQDIMARALTRINEAVLATERAHIPNRTIVAFTGRGDTTVTYTPARDFETDENLVVYPFPGMDVNAVSVALGQMVAAGVISRSTARQRHPFVDDAEAEGPAIDAEFVAEAVKQGFAAQVASGAVPLVDAARVYQLLLDGNDLVTAITKANREAQERQAAVPPPPPPTAAVPPETQPGLALPGQGVESQPAPPPAPASPVEALRQLLGR